MSATIPLPHLTKETISPWSRRTGQHLSWVFSPVDNLPGEGGEKLSEGDLEARRCLDGVFWRLSIRCALHKRERVPAGIFSPGFPLTTPYKPGLKTHIHPPTTPSAVLQRRPRISTKSLFCSLCQVFTAFSEKLHKSYNEYDNFSWHLSISPL